MGKSHENVSDVEGRSWQWLHLMTKSLNHRIQCSCVAWRTAFPFYHFYRSGKSKCSERRYVSGPIFLCLIVLPRWREFRQKFPYQKTVGKISKLITAGLGGSLPNGSCMKCTFPAKIPLSITVGSSFNSTLVSNANVERKSWANSSPSGPTSIGSHNLRFTKCSNTIFTNPPLNDDSFMSMLGSCCFSIAQYSRKPLERKAIYN